MHFLIKNIKYWAKDSIHVILLGIFVLVAIYNIDNTKKINQSADLIIKGKVPFNKHYLVKYNFKQLQNNTATIIYTIISKDNRPINHAKLKLTITPNKMNINNITLTKPISEQNGIYTFKIKLQTYTSWNLKTKIRIRRYERMFNHQIITSSNHSKS